MTFKDVKFEVKNTVTHAYKNERSKELPHSESNMDIQLIDNNKNSVLFLESKFSEYLKNGAVYDIDEKLYHDIYNDLNCFLEDKELVFVAEKDKKGKMKLSEGNRTCNYLAGIKQMISHFMGVCEYASIAENTQQKIYLGIILYKFNDKIDCNSLHYTNYAQLYTSLAKQLNALLKTNNINNVHVIENPFTYQKVFNPDNNYKLYDRVKQFYDL